MNNNLDLHLVYFYHSHFTDDLMYSVTWIVFTAILNDLSTVLTSRNRNKIISLQYLFSNPLLPEFFLVFFGTYYKIGFFVYRLIVATFIGYVFLNVPF